MVTTSEVSEASSALLKERDFYWLWPLHMEPEQLSPTFCPNRGGLSTDGLVPGRSVRT